MGYLFRLPRDPFDRALALFVAYLAAAFTVYCLLLPRPWQPTPAACTALDYRIAPYWQTMACERAADLAEDARRDSLGLTNPDLSHKD